MGENCVRRLALSASVVLLALGAAIAAQGPADGGAPPRPAGPRIAVELSELLTHSPLAPCVAGAAPRRPIRARIGTWNIRAARTASIEAIAEELRAMQPDIVALQEVDVRTRRGSYVGQPQALSAALGLDYAFAASIKWDEGDYGLAVLTRWPLVAVQRHRLPSRGAFEPRIVLEAAVCVGGRMLRLFNLHADNREVSRHAGFAEVRRILEQHIGSGLVVAGDFNEPLDGPGVAGLMSVGLVSPAVPDPDPDASGWRIDHLLADGRAAEGLSQLQIWQTERSDHHAVSSDLLW